MEELPQARSAVCRRRKKKTRFGGPKLAAGVAGLSLRPKRVGNVKEINRTLSRLNVEKNEA